MPEVTLKFQLPEEEDEFNDAVHGHRKAQAFLSVLWDLDQRLRSIYKYEEDKQVSRCNMAAEIRELIAAYMRDEEIEF